MLARKRVLRLDERPSELAQHLFRNAATAVGDLKAATADTQRDAGEMKSVSRSFARMIHMASRAGRAVGASDSSGTAMAEA